jgi:hypothetical protein
MAFYDQNPLSCHAIGPIAYSDSELILNAGIV